MAAVTGAMTQEARAADNDSDETETVLLAVRSVNRMVRACIEKDAHGSARCGHRLATLARGHDDSELIEVPARAARDAYLRSSVTVATKDMVAAFRSALASVDGNGGVLGKGLNERLAKYGDDARDTGYGSPRTSAVYENLSRE